jgi:hypothetical protein
VKAPRRPACSRQEAAGALLPGAAHSQAPRPGAVRSRRNDPSADRATRTSSAAGAARRQPTHVRTGCGLCGRLAVLRRAATASPPRSSARPAEPRRPRR